MPQALPRPRVQFSHPPLHAAAVSPRHRRRWTWTTHLRAGLRNRGILLFRSIAERIRFHLVGEHLLQLRQSANVHGTAPIRVGPSCRSPRRSRSSTRGPGLWPVKWTVTLLTLDAPASGVDDILRCGFSVFQVLALIRASRARLHLRSSRASRKSDRGDVTLWLARRLKNASP